MLKHTHNPLIYFQRRTFTFHSVNYREIAAAQYKLNFSASFTVAMNNK